MMGAVMKVFLCLVPGVRELRREVEGIRQPHAPHLLPLNLKSSKLCETNRIMQKGFAFSAWSKRVSVKKRKQFAWAGSRFNCFQTPKMQSTVRCSLNIWP